MRPEHEWNPWHGCHKISEGCLNCYVYRRDATFGKDSRIITQTKQFGKPLVKKRDGSYAIPAGSHVYACMTSDFFVDAADGWRAEAWRMIHQRPDVHFTLFTKRIDRFGVALPDDWGTGYANVTIGCTCESLRRAKERMPVFLDLPIQDRMVLCEPMLDAVDLSPWLDAKKVRLVVAGGESGEGARPLQYDWVLGLRAQCVAADVAFHFKQTGAHFVKDGRVFQIPRSQQMMQARKANIEYSPHE